jgi:hypothetical protein
MTRAVSSGGSLRSPADQAKASEMKDQLECRRFLVIKILTPTFAKPTQRQSD